MRIFKVAVYDLGGGTFDISILELGNGIFEVKSTNGNTRLGGDDFDQAIVNWLKEEFKIAEGIDLPMDPRVLQRLKEAAETAKIELSFYHETEINLPYLLPEDGVPRHLARTLSRVKFEQLINGLLQSTISACRIALKNARLKASDLDEILLVGGSTRIPAVKKLVREIFGKEPAGGVNPDEVVAIGAAIQGGVLSGDVRDVLLLDVTPLSLGIETKGGVMTRLIEANTTVPTRQSEIFSTAADNQLSMEIHILQGERPMASQNKSIGRFHFDEIPPLRRSIPKIEVTFDIDVNGILQVKAIDQLTGKSQQVRIEASSGLSQEDILRMKKEALQYEEEDREAKERADLNNQADTLVHETENLLKIFGNAIASIQKSTIQLALDELKSVQHNENHSELELALDNLRKVCRLAGTQSMENG